MEINIIIGIIYLVVACVLSIICLYFWNRELRIKEKKVDKILNEHIAYFSELKLRIDDLENRLNYIEFDRSDIGL